MFREDFLFSFKPFLSQERKIHNLKRNLDNGSSLKVETSAQKQNKSTEARDGCLEKALKNDFPRDPLFDPWVVL